MNQCDSNCDCGCDKRHYIMSERDLKELANTHPSELQGAGFFSWLKKKATPITNVVSRISNRLKSAFQQKPHIKSAPLPKVYSVGDEGYNNYPSKTNMLPVFEWFESQDEGRLPNMTRKKDYEFMASYMYKNAPEEYYQEFLDNLRDDYEQTYSGPGGTGSFVNDIGDFSLGGKYYN
jgi:hypothetical protein